MTGSRGGHQQVSFRAALMSRSQVSLYAYSLGRKSTEHTIAVSYSRCELGGTGECRTGTAWTPEGYDNCASVNSCLKLYPTIEEKIADEGFVGKASVLRDYLILPG